MRRRPAAGQHDQFPHRRRTGALRRRAGCGGTQWHQTEFAPADGGEPGAERSAVMRMRDSGSVRRKLILMAVSTTMAALVAASVAMLLVDLRAFQRYWTDDLMTQADIMARVTAPALAFNDNETARQNLAVLRVRPQILAAAIYTSNGSRFAAYVAPGA